MEENEFKPLFKELWKQVKVIFELLLNIGKVLSNRLEHSAKAKVIKNPITTIVVSNAILGLLLLFSNLGWFVKYTSVVRDGDYIEMQIEKRVEQSKLSIEAEADELASNRYQAKTDSLEQEIIKLKEQKSFYYQKKKVNTNEANLSNNDAENDISHRSSVNDNNKKTENLTETNE